MNSLLLSERPPIAGCSDPSSLEIEQRHGVSSAVICKSVVPLRIHNPIVSGPCCHALLANYGGGMLDGDRICLDIECRQGARLNVGSVGSLQVYKSPQKGTFQHVRGTVGPEALVVFGPDPVVLHSEAVYAQSHEWHVARGGSLLVGEFMLAGRLETGERFAFTEYSTQMAVYADDELLLYDRFAFRSSGHEFRDPATFAGRGCFLCMYMIGERWTALSDRLAGEAQSLMSRSGTRVLASVHPLERNGHVLRALADKPGDLLGFFDCAYDFLEDVEFLGFNPRKRKY